VRRILRWGWWVVGAVGTFLTYLGLFDPKGYKNISETDWLTFIGSDLFRTILVIVGLGLIFLAVIKGRHQPRQQVAGTNRSTQPKAPVEQERVFVGAGVTPEYLFSLFEGKTDIQAQRTAETFIGKWMPIAGPLRSVSKWTGTYSQVTVDLGDAEMLKYKSMYLVFHDESYVARLEVLAPGDPITVHGRIDRIESTNVQLEDCELVDRSRALGPDAST
jgi:hypothetical protein